MPEYVTRRQAVSPQTLAALRAFVDSPLVARSTLAGSFRGSRGFAVTFTTAGIDRLRERFGALGPFVDLALGEPDALAPLTTKLLRRAHARKTNAFYLNLLLLSGGGSVGRHTDATLRGPSGVADAVPERVSVLYLSVVPGTGGQLQLFRGDRRVGSIQPREAALVHFRGDLQHEVTAVASFGEGVLRASLVCEQYHFDEIALERLPAFQLHSKAPFERHLAAWERPGPKDAAPGDA